MDLNRKIIDSYVSSLAVSFGKEIISKREKLGLSRMQLAKKALMSYKWLQAIEHGDKTPSLYIITSLSLALDSHEWESLKPTVNYGFKIKGKTMYLSHISNPEK